MKFYTNRAGEAIFKLDELDLATLSDNLRKQGIGHAKGVDSLTVQASYVPTLERLGHQKREATAAEKRADELVVDQRTFNL